MEQFIFSNKKQLGSAAAKAAVCQINTAIENNGFANIIVATGTSQFETLTSLISHDEVNWSEVVMFHLDEYIGLSEQHPASFRKYLRERFIDKVGPLRSVYLVNGDSQDPEAECERLSDIIRSLEIDVALLGIGENGHLAFNDPPANFDTKESFVVVQLDEKCRKQQLNEGWFESLDEIPRRAISMSITQIMKSKHLIVSVSEKRKAEAVKASLEEAVSKMCPASILQIHPSCKIFMDDAAASLINL